MRSQRFGLILTLFIVVALIGLTAVNYNFARQSPGGSDFGLCLVWPPDQMACDPTEPFPVADYFQSH